jgi:tetratricopeptide (TPR) repeat protein
MLEQTLDIARQADAPMMNMDDAVFTSTLSQASICAGLMRFVVLSFLLICAVVAQTQNPEQLFRDAVAAQSRGDDAAAISKYQQLLKIRPDVVEVRANLGAALARQGRFDEAIEQYTAALGKRDNPGLRLNLALAHYKKGGIPDAVKQLEILRSAEPRDVRVATLLADCYARLGQDDRVISLLTPLEATNRDDLALEWMLGSALVRTAKRAEGLERVELVAKRGNSAEAYLLAGQTALKLDDFERARDHADAVIRLNPALPGALTLRGMVLPYLGDNQGAITALKKALEADVNDFDAHLHLGGVLTTERDLEGARKHIEKALQLQPSSNLARYELARLERTEGKLEAAAANFEKVIREDPNWAQPHIELSAVYFKLNRQEDGEREKAAFDRLSATNAKR